MVLSSCTALLFGSLASFSVIFSLLLSTPNLIGIFNKLKTFDFKSAFSQSAFLPVTVPAMTCLILVISISLTKELKINDTTLVTYKKCESKSVETKLASLKIPSCLVALN